MIFTLIICCSVIVEHALSKLNSRQLLVTQLLSGVSSSNTSIDGFIIGFKQTVYNIHWGNTPITKHKYGNIKKNAFNKEYGIGSIQAWSNEHKWGASSLDIYQTKHQIVGGIQLMVNNKPCTNAEYNKISWWGIQTETDGYKRLYLGNGLSWNSELKEWGYSQLWWYVKGGKDVIVGFKQIGSDLPSDKEWVIESKWGTTHESDDIVQVLFSEGQAWNEHYECWGNSKKYIYIKKQYLLPIDYKFHINMKDFDFGDINGFMQNLNASKEVAFTDRHTIDVQTNGSHTAVQTFTEEIQQSYTFSKSFTWGIETEFKAEATIPLFGSASVTVKPHFEHGTQRTTTETTTKTYCVGCQFTPPHGVAGLFEVGMIVWQIKDKTFDYTAKLYITAKDSNGDRYSGVIVAALLKASSGFNKPVTSIGNDHVIVNINGEIEATICVESYQWNKKLE
eukprot:327755_1